jgi:hypothetical protein
LGGFRTSRTAGSWTPVRTSSDPKFHSLPPPTRLARGTRKGEEREGKEVGKLREESIHPPPPREVGLAAHGSYVEHPTNLLRPPPGGSHQHALFSFELAIQDPSRLLKKSFGDP